MLADRNINMTLGSMPSLQKILMKFNVVNVYQVRFLARIYILFTSVLLHHRFFFQRGSRSHYYSKVSYFSNRPWF